MPKVIEVIYEDGVFKPLEKVDLREGEKVKIRIEKKIDFEPIRLKKKVSIEKIKEIRSELWTSF
ncbi:MAG: antitoxin [Archaeoglobales archaeon]|nr:MAG: antitoxin [Archaeoglobales archaeon]